MPHISRFVPSVGVVLPPIEDIPAVSGALTTANKDMIPAATVGNDAPTGLVLTFTPIGERCVIVFVNGVEYTVGNGVKTKACYFSSDGGVTAKTFITFIAGDFLFWNGVIAGFNLAITDKISFDYDV